MTEPRLGELLARLDGADVRFVLVGGLAAGSFGVVRGTKDVDLVADPDPENLDRLAELAVELGGHVQTGESLAGSAPSIAVLLRSGDRVLIETRLGPLDVVQGLPGVPAYADLAERSRYATVEGADVRVCSLEDLREMKRTAGRARDLADLEDLDAAQPET